MFIPSGQIVKRTIKLYLSTTKGGPLRFQIIKILDEKGSNINEIAAKLNIDYKTAQYHIRILEKIGLIKSSKKKYDNMYSLSELLNAHKDVLKELEN